MLGPSWYRYTQSLIFQSLNKGFGLSKYKCVTTLEHIKLNEEELNVLRKDDSFVRKCFEYVEWNIEMIEKLNTAYEELEYSAKSRQNPSSIENADCRRTNYDLVIAEFKTDIMNVIQKANKQITDYVYIQSSLQKQNL